MNRSFLKKLEIHGFHLALVLRFIQSAGHNSGHWPDDKQVYLLSIGFTVGLMVIRIAKTTILWRK